MASNDQTNPDAATPTWGTGGVKASDGVILPLSSLAQVMGYAGSNLTTITVTYKGNTYVQTFTYTSTNLTGQSLFVKQ